MEIDMQSQLLEVTSVPASEYTSPAFPKPENHPLLKKIGIVLRPEFSLSNLANLTEVFRLANDLAAASTSDSLPYQILLLSRGGERIVSSSSVAVSTRQLGGYGVAQELDTVFVNDGNDSWCTLSEGAGMLALDAISVTSTPAVHFIAAATSGSDAHDNGTTIKPPEGASPIAPLSGESNGYLQMIKAALSVVENDLGVTIARGVFQLLSSSLDPHTSAIINIGMPFSPSHKIRTSARWLQENGHRPISVSEAADAAAMSERNFLRRFKREMGLAPSHYLLRIRLRMVCQLLVDTDAAVDKIARRCGIGGGEQLAKIFRKHLNVSPTEYRRTRRFYTVES
jgi:transcriptional regulator GlxA family with amidase domain